MADDLNNIPTPLIPEVASSLPQIPDPFETHRLVDNAVTYPIGHDKMTFVVDETNSSVRIQAALADASNVFAFHGKMSEPYGLWESDLWMPLFDGVGLTKDEEEAVKKSMERKELPIEALLKVATPASFGRDGESVFDPEFRKAFEIPWDRIPTTLLEALKAGYGIRDLESAMRPYFKKWTYQLYKIHMYGPGGKFNDHVDTLHGNNHVATVVLSLPSEHVGGVLRIQHHGEVIEFDSSKGPVQSKYTSGCRNFCYVAFFTDCKHSVQEVISGWRVVVQYDVYEEDKKNCVNEEQQHPNLDNKGSDSEDDEDVVSQVISCMEQPNSVSTKIYDKEKIELVQAVVKYLEKLPPTHDVGFFLRHRYSLPALNEVVLKGADRAIYDAFAKRDDLSITLQGVLVYIRTEDMDQVSIRVTAVSMKDFLPNTDGEQPRGNRKEKRTVMLIVDHNNGAMCVHESGETGNEPADGYTSYFVACMMIRSIQT